MKQVRQAIALLLLVRIGMAEDQPTAKPDAPQRQIVVLTVEEQELAATSAEVRDGALVLSTDPPRSIPLADIQRVTFTTATAASSGGAPENASTPIVWIGQDNHDLVGVGAAVTGNGIQDVHLRLFKLPEQPIKQARIVRRSPPRAWRLDPTGSPDWKMAIERQEGASSADVYIEPPAGDLFDQPLELTLTFQDNSTTKAQVKATTHTSDSTKAVEAPSVATPNAPPAPSATADLDGGDSVRGDIVSLTEETLVLDTAWQPKLEIPLLKVRGLRFAELKSDAKSRYEPALAKPAGDDLAVVLAKDGSLAEVAGRVKQADATSLRMIYEGEERGIPRERVQGVIFAAHPRARATEAPYQVVRLTVGDVLSGAWQGISSSAITVQPTWGGSLQIPLEQVAEIGCRNGKLVYLADLEPTAVEQTPYFGRLIPYRKNESLDGSPLQLKGKTHASGLAVHSRCVLSYALDGRFETFKTMLGFDASSRDRGCVNCRVLGDDRELYARQNLRPKDDPQPLELSVSGVQRLTLEIDFGDEEDTGDRIIWGSPRLYR